jgi:ABC-2 type transport system permease protein
MTTISAAQPRQRFSGLLSSERIKLTSLSSMRWMALLVLVLGVIGAVLPANTPAGVMVNVGSVGSAAVGLIGAIASSAEFATGTIRQTILNAPRRGRAVAAKTLVTAATGFVLGIASAIVAVPVAGADTMTTAAFAVSALGLAVFYAAVAAFMTLVGFVVRRVPVAVTIAVAFLFLTPGLTGGIVVGDHVYLSDFTLSEAGIGLVLAPELGSGIWQSLVVTLAWPAVAAAVATVLVKRRDV